MDRNWVLGAAAIAFGGCATANDGGGEDFEPPGVPSYEEDWFADAWGLDATHPAGVAAVTRTGARRSMYPLQTSLVVEATGGPDAFGLVEATNDPLVPWYFHLSVNGLAPPNVAGAESDLSAHVTAPNVHTLWIASSQAPNPNLRPWNQHHTFLFDDVGMWTQTGLSSWLANLPL